MKSITRIVGQHKSRFMRSLCQLYIINKLRLKINIGQGCRISKSVDVGTDIIVKDRVTIGENVTIGHGVRIGNYASIRNISINENSIIDSGVLVMGTGMGRISVGKECYIGPNNILDCSADIIINDFVHIAGSSTGLWTHSSAKKVIAGLPLKSDNSKSLEQAPITVGNNVFIGGNCTIYPGVIIGSYSIIAPNSVVNKDIEPYTLTGGVPAKTIRKLQKSE